MEFNEDDEDIETIPNRFKALVYFLINEKEVVYVGQTNNGLTRPFSHTDKNFTEVKIFPCLPQQLDYWEDHFIQKYKPIHNKQCNYKMRWGLQRVKKSIRKYKYPKYTLWDLRSLLKILKISTQKDIRNKETITFDDYKKVMEYFGITDEVIDSGTL
jgi:hypothetical protein